MGEEARSDVVATTIKQRHVPSDKRKEVSFRVIFQVTFPVFFLAHMVSALYAPISDCDEVFNYWEPTHYISHGTGFQTWEYSPEYSIRSWAYILPHSLIISLSKLLLAKKHHQFIFLRLVLAAFTASCESRLFFVVSRSLSPRIAFNFLIIAVTSTGMFQASTAFLPSSFAMNTSTLGLSAFIDWNESVPVARALFWFTLSSVIGWPFASILVVPFVVGEFIVGMEQKKVDRFLRKLLIGLQPGVILVVLTVVIDSLFYGKLVFPALNAILYNVLSGPGKGPNIFGTEPWHFYFKNLLLNFGFWLLPATVALPAILLRQRSSEKPWGSIEKWRHLTLTVPFYVWLTIFSLQPHKEERFLFPVYPFLMMNAAISLHYFMIYFGSQNSHAIFNKLPARLRLLLIFAYYIAAIATGIARTCGVIDAYIAPASIYLELQKQAIPGNSQTFCLGKEWYRFPSSFFVPSTIQSGFIQSDFTGLLPGKYEESKGHGLLLSGTRAYPKGMNDMNLQDPGKFVDIARCSFIIDTSFPNRHSSEREPDYVSDTAEWQPLKCVPFLDAEQTTLLARVFWTPGWSFIPERYQRQWGRYCLLKRR